jgi:prepilin-type N-terminal cleavage/methylation domain-containing protein
MIRKFKKGFTLVELVVVIAVIAILAAVSIVSYMGITKKAKESNDHMVIDQINTSLHSSQILENKATVHEIVERFAEEEGYDVRAIKPELKNTRFVYSYEKGKFGYWKDNKVAYPADLSEIDFTGSNDLWFFEDTAQAKYQDSYSHYLKSAGTLTAVEADGGLDVGNCDTITSIKITRTTQAKKDVVVRTNGGTLTVNAVNDTVKHYGEADSVNIVKVASASYHENGTVPFIQISQGRIELEATADVNGIHVANVQTVDANGNITKTENAFSNDVVLTLNGNDVKLTRDTIGTEIATPVLVCQVQANTNSDEYIWLYGDGTIENAKVYVTETKTIPNTSVDSTTTTENASAAAIAIANNAINTGTEEAPVWTAEEAGKTADEAQTESALKGLGTEADPFLVYDYETMQKISDFYDLGYFYFEIAIGKTNNGVIDCSNWKSVKLCGSFDGKGVIFNKPSDALFECVVGINQDDAYVKNFTINSVYEVRTGYYCAPVVDWTEELNIFTIENVKVSGYAEATIISSFVGWSEAKTTLIKNSESSLTLVSTGSQVSGFVGNSLGVNNVTVIDSIFSGSEVSTANSGQYLYAHNNSNCTLTLSYTDSFKDSHPNLYPEFSNKATQVNSYSVYSKITKQSLTLPEAIGTPITVDKDPTAVKAVATYVIGVNPGCFTRVYQRDEIDLTGVSGSTFNTTTVKKYNIVINDGIHNNEAVGNTQYIKDSACDGTYECVVFTVVQYDATGSITSIRTSSLPGNH